MVVVTKPLEKSQPTFVQKIYPKSLQECFELTKTSVREKDGGTFDGCHEYIKSNLSQQNVLEVYTFLCELESPGVVTEQDVEAVPSAPPAETDGLLSFDERVAEIVSNVRIRCLMMIDENAQDLFTSKERVAKLPYEVLYELLTRDDLNIDNEEIIYSTMYEWGKKRCEFKGPLMLAKALGDLIKAPRYGLMTMKRFKNLKGVQYLLNDQDWRLITFYLKEKSNRRSTYELPNKWSKPRKCPNRSDAARKNRDEEVSVCDGIILNLLRCWVSIFD